MSWSFQFTGRPALVAAEVKKYVDSVKCAEPEETVKASIGAAIQAALSAYPEEQVVEVNANGSQGPAYDRMSKLIEGKHVNNAHLSITPKWGMLL